MNVDVAAAACAVLISSPSHGGADRALATLRIHSRVPGAAVVAAVL